MIIIGVLIHSLQLPTKELNILVHIDEQLFRIKYNAQNQEHSEKKQLLYQMTADAYQHLTRTTPLKLYFIDKKEREIGRTYVSWEDALPKGTSNQAKSEKYDIRLQNRVVGHVTLAIMAKKTGDASSQSLKGTKVKGKKPERKVKRPKFKKITWANTIEQLYVYEQ